MKPVVVIPTYNEKENVEAMAEAVLAILPAEGMILFCDDNSPDGTGAIIDGLCANNPRIKVLHREKKEGLGRAYVAGFARALALGATHVIEMDCDFSHDPKDVARMLEAIADADVVIGSRYVRGGKCVGWPFKRWAISRGGGIFIRIVLGLPVKDPTGGFKCFTRAALETRLFFPDGDELSHVEGGPAPEGDSHYLRGAPRRLFEDQRLHRRRDAEDGVEVACRGLKLAVFPRLGLRS